jgi:hypothetical protein
MDRLAKGRTVLSLHSISQSDRAEEWKPRRGEYLVMATLSVISLMVALDATILVPVLPVSLFVLQLSR